MELGKVVVLAALALSLFLLIYFSIRYTIKSKKAVKLSQQALTDKELIEFINNEPDKIINAESLMNNFGLTKFEAGGRLRHFLSHGILKGLMSGNGMSYYYTLAKPVEHSYDLELTDDAFMTVQDLLLIFKHYDYQVTLQELCLSTGLPLKVIVEEMKHFEKEKIVRRLLMSNQGGHNYQKVYMLCEPYRSNPEEFLKLKELNFELKTIYAKVTKK